MAEGATPQVKGAIERGVEVVEKSAKIGVDARNQLLVRFPKEIADLMGLKVGDKLWFKLTVPTTGVSDDCLQMRVERV